MKHAALLTRWAIVAACVRNVVTQNLPLPPLPYDYNGLEPHIDSATMKVHHLKHHQTYTDKLNGGLEKLRADPEHKYLAKMGIDALLQHLGEVPDDLRRTIRNAGGGYVNHDLFFRCMSPDGGGAPQSAALSTALTVAFGSLDAFKRAFNLAALELFGSGWVWLVYDKEKAALGIMSTPNQDTPAMEVDMVPILGLDVWEHAYYLKHQSARKNYVDDFWNVVHWPEVARRLDAAAVSTAEGKAEL